MILLNKIKTLFYDTELQAEQLFDLKILYDPKDHSYAISDKFEYFLGIKHSKEPLSEFQLLKVVHEDDQSIFLLQLQRLLEGKIQDYNGTCRFLIKGGEARVIQFKAICSSKGNTDGLPSVLFLGNPMQLGEQALEEITQGTYKQMLIETQKNLQETKYLYEVSNALVLLESTSEILHRIGEIIANSIPTMLVTIITMDNENITHFVGAGKSESKTIQVDYAELQEGLAGWVTANRRPALSLKDFPDERESKLVHTRRRDANCGDIIVAPMIFRDEILGIVTVINSPDERSYTQEDVRIIQLLANQAGISVKNAELYEQAEKELEERVRVEGVLKDLATHDELTKLGNRRLFYDRLAQSIRINKRNENQLALLYLDLDGFKEVNDLKGHEFGDQLLQLVARKIENSIRESDTACRIGGDEFAIVLEHANSKIAIDLVAKRILGGINNIPSEITQEFKISGSIGVSIFPSDGESAEQLINFSDIAMYYSKSMGKNQICYYSETHK
jgi:diguanylate cyclase (GGDEF)-like protein